MPVPYLGIAVEKPTQHQAPLFKYLSKEPRFRIKVLYFTRRGLEPYYYTGLGAKLSYDIPLLKDYDHAFLKNSSPIPNSEGRFSNLDLDIYEQIRQEKFDAVCV